VEQQQGNRQLVLTRVGATLCGIDIDRVHEIIPVPPITAVPKSPVNVLGVIDVRGAVIPVACLRACLGVPPAPITHDTRIVLVNYHDEKIGLVVDAVSEVTTLAGTEFQSMEQTHGDSAFLRAVARFEGELVLELDHTRVIDERLNVAPPPADVPVLCAGAIEEQVPVDVVRQDGEAAVDAVDAPADVTLLETSYAFLAQPADQLAKRTFALLFEAAPELRSLFAADLKGQQRALSAALGTIVGHLRSPEMLAAYVGGLGERHAGYGARPEHYGVFAEAMLGAMAETGGDRWSPALASAWRRCLAHIQRLMIEGAADSQAKAA
jgi:chemotaxis signal transduction protein/hemoglobin-like flavoprotein